MKRILPFVAAVVITGTLACGALAVGVAAATNPNGVRVSDSPSSASAPTANASLSPSGDQIAQWQALIQQYQDRERQYQDQLVQAQTAIDNYQQILTALQQAGVLRITNDGRLLVRVPEEDGS
jgi:hypothetical protein